MAAKSASGEVLQFFPREGSQAPVTPGVDVPLSYSTPVQGGWLSAPMEVRAQFTDDKGQVLGETQVMLTPAKKATASGSQPQAVAQAPEDASHV